MAAQWYQKAIDNGCVWAMRNLANYYLQGRGGLEESEEKGVELLTEAAEKGFTGAYVSLGKHYLYDLGNYKLAEEYYLKAIEAGETQAYRDLGLMYMYYTNEFEKAEECLLKAAETGNSFLYSTLGDFYNGVGGRKMVNIEKAIEWYNRSIETDDPSPNGYFQLGLLYYGGNGVGRDYEKAFELFSKAAELYEARYNNDAMYPEVLKTIGEMYEAGLGVEKDREKAREYYDRAEELESSR